MNDTLTDNYRVIATTTTGFVDPRIDITVKWEGTDTDELSREYPPSDIMFADPLEQKEIEDGFIITRFTFEQQLADGSWEEIDDPRRRLTPMTDYERAIDEENRRLFPGDYIDVCDRCGYDPCECYSDEPRCKHCDDYGCAKCDPNWCSDCDNYGCATCDPSGVCKDCKQYMADVDTLDQNGRCDECGYYASLCPQCGHNPCQCSDYEQAAALRCGECGYRLQTGDDKLCDDCRELERKLKQYFTWWRRALRACKFW